MRVPDRTLRRWLRSGRPNRVERQLGDPAISERLEEMTALDTPAREALDALTTPEPEALERVASAVDEKVNNRDLAALVDLVGLGWHTAAAVVDPDPEPESDS